MTPGRFATVTIVAAIALFLSGYVIWPLALSGFMEGQMIPGAEAVAKPMEEANFLFIFLAQVAYAAFLTLTVGSWAGRRGFGPGFTAGATVGFLAALSMAFMFYATANMMTLTGHLVDAVATLVWAGIGGGVVGVMMARGESSA